MTVLLALAGSSALTDPPELALDLDAEHTWAARDQRALGAAAFVTGQLGTVNFSAGPTIARDIPLIGDSDAGLKLGAAATCELNLRRITPVIAGVVENGAPRLDLGLEINALDELALTLHIEDVMTPQLRFVVEWTL